MSRTANEEAPPHSPRGWLVFASLAVFQAFLLWGFPHWSDINIQDEAQYMRQGQLLATGHFLAADYAWSLPLSSIYALLQRLGVATHLQPDLVSVGCSFASVLALYWALSKLLPWSAAYLAACWWASSAMGINLHAANSYVLGFVLICLAVGLVARERFLPALGMAIVASLNRAELSLWLALAGVLWLLAIHRKKLEVPRAWAFGYMASGMLLTALLSYGWRARNRNWFAFRQHFQWGHPEGAATEVLFPGAASLLESARVNPEAFLQHLLRNLAEFPRVLAGLVFDVWSWVPGVGLALGTAAVLLAGIGTREFFRNRRGPLHARRLAAVLLLAATPAVSVVSLLLMPRAALLLPLVPLALFVLFGLGMTGWTLLRGRLAMRSAPTLLILLAPAVAAWFGGQLLRNPAAPQPPNRAAIALIQARVPPGATLLASQALELLMYADVEDVTAIDPTALDFETNYGDATIKTLVEQLAPSFLLDNQQLRDKPGAAGELERLLQDPAWYLVEQRGAVKLFAR